MGVNPAIQRCLDQWYPLKPHPKQIELINAVGNGVRFPIVPAGRRSGKTIRAKRFIARNAMTNPGEMYFAAAPTYQQAKRIWWSDLKKLTFSVKHLKPPSESELIIYLPNESQIHVVGLDKPARFEGIPWTGGVIDEIADIKGSAVNENIMPALNTVDPRRPDYRAWCWFIGVPDGLNHFYDMAEYAQTANDPDWACYHWTSAEILPPEVIEAAKRTMSARQFRQEYEASFEAASGRIYEDYGTANLTDATIQPHEQLCWMHDQNYTPLSSAVGVVRDGALYLLGEIVLASAVSRQSAEEFVERYATHENKHVLIYGDPAGRAGEKHGQESAYTAMEDVLRNHGWKYTRKVKRAHPSIKDRQNQVRSKICNAMGERSLFVNPSLAPYCHKGLKTVQLKKGSTFLEEDSEEQHITTAIGYMVDVEWPVNPMAMDINLRVAN
jgi:hypothetical protein